MKYKIRRFMALIMSALMFVLAIPFPSFAADVVIPKDYQSESAKDSLALAEYKGSSGWWRTGVFHDVENGNHFFGVKSTEKGRVFTHWYVTEVVYNVGTKDFVVGYADTTGSDPGHVNSSADSWDGVLKTGTTKEVSVKIGDVSTSDSLRRQTSLNGMNLIFGEVKNPEDRIWVTTGNSMYAGAVALDILAKGAVTEGSHAAFGVLDGEKASAFKLRMDALSGSEKQVWENLKDGVLANSASITGKIVTGDTYLDDFLGEHEEGQDPRSWLGALYRYLGDSDVPQAEGTTQGTLQGVNDQRGPELNIASLTGDENLLESGDYDVDSEGNTLVWEHWYQAALFVASGTEMKDGIFNNPVARPSPAKDQDLGATEPGVYAEVDSDGNTESLYGSFSNLQQLMVDRPNATNWRKAYEVLSIAALGMDTHTAEYEEWFGSSKDRTSDVLKSMRGRIVSEDNDQTVSQDNDQLDTLKQQIVDAGTIGGDKPLKRFTSLASRLKIFFISMGLEDTPLNSSEYPWLDDYYTENAWTIYAEMVEDSMVPFLRVDNSGRPLLATSLGEGQEWAAWYALATLYEIPWLTSHYMKELNDEISANTDLSNNDLYKAVKSVYDAKESLKIPLLDFLWEKELEPENGETANIQYKSLAKIWDAMNGLTDSKSIEDDPESAPPLETGKPMKWFFSDYNTGKLSDFYLQGIAYTSTLVPMRSNVYSKEWLRYMDYEFFEDFYYRWGFNRKALFIDQSSGSVESYFSQGNEEKTRGRTKVCTLRDLVESKGDVTLYLDDNFYNSKNIQERYMALQSAGRTNYNSGALDTAMATDDTTAESGNKEKYTDNVFNRYGWWTTVAANIEEMYGTDFENIVKTNESTNYSKTFYDMMSKLDGGHVYYPEATADNVGNNDNAVLSSGRINYYLNSENAGSEVYSPIQGYAVVSSVYRDADLFNKANSAEIQRPVFMASQTAPYMKNASLEACETIFNWALLKNLKDAMPVGYAGNIDMDCPIYMDILGNIVTESGTVVVPAASNATIMNPATYCENMYSAGLFAIYGMDYYIPVKDNESSVFKSMMQFAFEPDDSGKYYIASPRTVGDDSKVDMSRLSATSKTTLDILYQQTWAKLYNMEGGKSGYNFDNYFNICMEVLRGAPMESIDKVQEGIDTSGRIDRAGIVAAAKLEELNEALATGAENTTLYIPNLAFMPGLTYVAMMAFKLLLLVVILVSMATVYFDAVSESLGFGTMWKCVQALLITMLTLFTVPAVFEATYYQSNRALLQDEAIRIAMLNYEKSASGVEIGVTEVKEPDMDTTLYIKLQEINVPWYELFYDSIFTNSYASLSAMYEDYAYQHSFVANADDVDVKNDGVYVDVQRVFESSSVDLSMNVENTDIRRLVQTASVQTTSLSFYSPYYAILDALIQNVNYYNDNPWGENSGDAASVITGWYSYTTTEQKGGKIKTMGLIEPYFTSDRFLYDDAKDPLGLKYVYQNVADSGYAPDPAIAGYFSAENLTAMRQSGWFAYSINGAECDKRLEFMTERARRFVAKNKELIGKISDDTFLKAMALSMAIEHNRAFGARSCDSLELYNLSNDDLIRLSIADRDEVMVNSTLSYPRFVYTVGGSPAVFAAALLSMVMWISGIVKPLLVIVAFVTIFVSIFIFRVCMRKEGTSLYGYFITALLLSLTNIAYSLMLKASMFLPVLHFTPFMCILVQIVLQITYMVILLNVVGTAFKDWRDLGYARYANKTQDLRIGFLQMFNKSKNANNPFYGGSTKISDPEKNWSYYDDMMEERKRRSR